MRIFFGLAFALLPALPDAAQACACRAKDVVAREGETVCISTPWGKRLARCDKVLNNTSWTFLETPCPVARSVPLRRFSPSMRSDTPCAIAANE